MSQTESTAGRAAHGMQEAVPGRIPDRIPLTRIINPQFNAQPGGAGEADFTQIDQIGAGRAKTLHEAGIRTFRELANTPIERMRELFPPPVKEDQLREWLQAAKQLAG